MPITALSLSVVGADFPNKRSKITRRFEIELCAPGEPVQLVPEPKNPADPNAVAVLSARGIQIGYVTAERAPWIRGLIADGRELRAIFQRKASYGAVIRLGIDEEPVLPVESPPAPPPDESGFWPDEVWPDE